MAIFRSDTLPERLVAKVKAYIWLPDILGLTQNDSKDCQGIVVTVVGIEVDTPSFTA